MDFDLSFKGVKKFLKKLRGILEINLVFFDMLKTQWIVVKHMLIPIVAKEKLNFVNYGLFVSMQHVVLKVFVMENSYMVW